MLNVFTVDLEDWYQGLELDYTAWQGFESRIESSTDRLLELLDRYRVKATFFVLGYVAEQNPGLIKRIVEERHEIGSHGYSHRFLYDLSPELLREELSRSNSLLGQLSGQKVVSFRAPFFSITKDSLWALTILKEKGFLYDSSIFPIHNYRYGLPTAPTTPFRINLNGNSSLSEYPISTIKLGRVNFPFSGGAYFRLFPYSFTKFCIKKLNQSQIPVIFYIHPWELDPHHPRVKLPRRISLTHYARLNSTYKKLVKLFKDFKFTTLKELAKGGEQGPSLLPEELA